jgi:hypothetical protein
VVTFDRVDPPRHIVERMTVRGKAEADAVQRGDEVEGLDEDFNASAPFPTPEMWGVIVGRTWSPERSTPCSGS